MTVVEPTRSDAAQRTWKPAAPVLVRANLLPGQPLADPTVARLVGELREATYLYAAARTSATEALATAISSARGDKREELIALRRRTMHDRPIPDTSIERFPDLAKVRVAGTRVDELRTELESELEPAIARERTSLAAMLSAPSVDGALALTSPNVHEAASRYRRSPGIPSRADRRAERTLLQFASRAALRTSPLSTYTAAGLATWSPDGLPLADLPAVLPATVRSTLDRPTLLWILGGIDSSSHWRQRSPTIQIEPGRLSWIAHAPDGRPRRLSTASTETLQTVLDLAEMGPVRAAWLAEETARRCTIDLEKASRLVGDATRIGLLTIAAPVDQQQADPIASMIETGSLTRDLADDLEALRTIGTSLAALSGDDRGAAMTSIRAASERASRGVNRPTHVGVQEDATIAVPELTAGSHAEGLDDVGAVIDLLGAFDRMHDVRLLLTQAVVDIHGAGCSINLVEHARSLIDITYRREGMLDANTAHDLGPADGTLCDLLDLRSRISAFCTEQIEGAGDDPEINWDPTELRRLSKLPPRLERDPSSYCVLAQLAGDGIVFNEAYPGRAIVHGRFLDGDPARTTALRERLVKLYGAGGARVVEDRGLHGAHVNLRPQVLAETITPEDWASLRLAHDAARDRLSVIDAAGAEIQILTLGTQWPELLPAPLRIATWLNTSGRLVGDVVDEVHRTLPVSDRTTARPRIVVGDVVMSRRRWYVGADAPLADGTATTDRLLALDAWRAEYDIPEQVVIKTPWPRDLFDVDNGSAPEFDALIGGRGREKPQLVELTSTLNAHVLPRLMRRRSAGWIEEALPAPTAGWAAREFAIDFDRPGVAK